MMGKKDGRKKFPTKSDWIGITVGFFPAALIVSIHNLPNSRVTLGPFGGFWVALIAIGGYYAAKSVAEKFIK